MREIELFSPEAYVVGAFSALLMLSGILQWLSTQTDRFNHINARMDRFTATIYQQGRVIPYLLLAAIIAVIAPVYDMYTDAEWIGSVARHSGSPDLPPPSWAELVQADPERRTLRHLIHVIQSAIALFFMWLYSLLWTFAIDRASRRGKAPRSALQRGVFTGGFGAALAPMSFGIQWMGQNPAFVLRVPL